MRIPNGKDFLLRSLPPFIICATLIYVPYFFFSQSELFSISLKYDALEHAVYGLLPASLVLAAAWIGRNGRQRHLPRPYMTTPWVRLILWTLLLVSMLAQLTQLVFASIAFLSGGYMAARNAAIVEGIGVLIRLDIILLPVICIVSRRKRKLLWTLALLALLHAGRAIVMSERVAIIEIICVAWVCLPLMGIYSISFKKGIVAAICTLLMFSTLLHSRLDQQSQLGGRFDSTSTSLMSSLSAYYADTMNKYYQVAAGDFDYPGLFFMAPILAITGGEAARAGEYKALLERLENSSNLVNKGLNNPGGLAQDVSDFGKIGYFVIFMKFLILSLAWRNRFRGPGLAACAPLVLITVLEYPRFNYLSLPFAAYLLFISLFIGFVVQKASRPAEH